MANERVVFFSDRNRACFVSIVRQQGQQDAPGTPSSKRQKHSRNKRTASRKARNETTEDPTRDSTSLGSSSGHTAPGGNRYDGVVEYPDEGDGGRREQHPAAPGELAIDVVPTASSKQCHSASVALRGTVDVEVRNRSNHFASSPPTVAVSVVAHGNRQSGTVVILSLFGQIV